MAILIDTQALAWVGVGNPRLSRAAQAAILDPDQNVLISAVTAYEFVDLNRRGHFGADLPFSELVGQLGRQFSTIPRRAPSSPDCCRRSTSIRSIAC